MSTLSSRQWNNCELIWSGWQELWALKAAAGDLSHLLSLSLRHADISRISGMEKSHKWRAYVICFGSLILNTGFILLLWIELGCSISSVIRVRRSSKSKESLACLESMQRAALLAGILLATKAYGPNFPRLPLQGPILSSIAVGRSAWWIGDLMNGNWWVRSDHCFNDTAPFAHSLLKEIFVAHFSVNNWIKTCVWH